jgi:hypothetical protein
MLGQALSFRIWPQQDRNTDPETTFQRSSASGCHRGSRSRDASMYVIQTFCEQIKYVPSRERAQNLFVDPAARCILLRQMHETGIRRCFRSGCEGLKQGGDIIAPLRLLNTVIYQPLVDCIEVFEIRCWRHEPRSLRLFRERPPTSGARRRSGRARAVARRLHVRDLEVDSVTNKAASGYTRTAIRSTADLAVDNLDVESVFSDDCLTEEDLQIRLR